MEVMPDSLDSIFEAASAESVVEDSAVEVDTDVEIDTDDNPEGIVEDTAGDEVADDEPEGSDATFDWEAYADQLVPITVQGQTEMVPLSELRSGFMRQSDYTRKTQEIAELEKAAKWAYDIRQAWETDPEGTAQLFLQAYGIDLNAPGQQQVDPLADVDEDLRPLYERQMQLERELELAKQQLGSVSQREMVEQVKAEVRQLQELHGDSFDPEATLRVAAAYNLPLDKAHAIVVAERGAVQSNPVVDSAAEQSKRAAESKRKESKQRAAGVAKGSFSANDVAPDEFNDIGELFEIVSNSVN
jgi:hypothetical protein